MKLKMAVETGHILLTLVQSGIRQKLKIVVTALRAFGKEGRGVDQTPMEVSSLAESFVQMLRQLFATVRRSCVALPLSVGFVYSTPRIARR